MTRILAVDYGLKRLGLALSDERRILATALETLLVGKNTEETARLLIEKARQCQACEIVIGLPLHLSGRTSFLADEVKHFVSILSNLTSLPIHLWDERLTSAEAERTLKLGGVNRKKRSGLVDSLSAVILLQSYLDAKSLRPPADNSN
ncbi:MAG: Holliday junction resolvase RuvX [Verrucomicrobia bacterium]|nr:Holliday junction resolvase RuvX [Verrucomicrobiota bacterium]MBS0647409.1 Holliday junction resolvase RuvX [Verrucomicrobiota bacterium]